MKVFIFSLLLIACFQLSKQFEIQYNPNETIINATCNMIAGFGDGLNYSKCSPLLSGACFDGGYAFEDILQVIEGNTSYLTTFFYHLAVCYKDSFKAFFACHTV